LNKIISLNVILTPQVSRLLDFGPQISFARMKRRGKNLSIVNLRPKLQLNQHVLFGGN